MAKPEEFTVTIGPDGRLRLDFRGMDVESYRRIVEVFEETIGPVIKTETEAREIPPPTVAETRAAFRQTDPAQLEIGVKKP